MRLPKAGLRLGASRVIEQGTLMLGAVLLARVSTPSEYAPVAVLLTVSSASLTLADLGLGVQVLRVPEAGIPRLFRRPLLVSAAIGLAVTVLSLLLPIGRDQVLIGVSLGLMWSLSTVLNVARSLALQQRREQLQLCATISASVGFLAAVLLLPSSIAVVAGVALVARSLIELALLIPLLGLSSAEEPHDWKVFFNQLLAFVGTNLDFVIVAAALGPEAFALYLLAFRVSAGPTAVLATVFTRIGASRLASMEPSIRSTKLRGWLRIGFGLGVLVALGIAAVSPLLGWLLGGEWASIGDIVRILAIATPFRLIHGLLGSSFLVEKADHLLLRIELVRVMASIVVLWVAAQLGLLTLSFAVVLVSAVAVAWTWRTLDSQTDINLRRSLPIG